MEEKAILDKAMAEEKGMEHMRELLRTFDPESAERLQDLRRIIRACVRRKRRLAAAAA